MADKLISKLTGQLVVLPHFVDFTTFTPVFTAPFGTVSTHSFQYSEKLTSLDVIGTLTTGTVDNGACRFSLPNAYTATRTQVVGQWWCYSNSASTKKRGTLYSTAGSNDIRFGNDDYTGTKAPFSDEPTRTDLGFVSGQQINIKIENMPISQLVALGPVRAYGAGVSAIAPSLMPGGVEETTHVSNFTGPFAAQSRTVEIRRRGKEVTLTFPETRASGSSSANPITMVTALPAAYRPKTEMFVPIYVTDNGTDQNQTGFARINTNGTITMNKQISAGSFTSTAATVGFYGFSITFATN